MPKITIAENPTLTDVEVLIQCPKRTPEVDSIVMQIELYNQTIMVLKDDQRIILPAIKIDYFESVDDQTFCYTAKAVYETPYRLYEIESALGNYRFARVNKSTIVNLIKIKSFKSALNGRMEALLLSGEKIEISRNYVATIKAMLGGIKR